MHAAHYALLSAVSAHRGATGAELARELSVTPQNVASLANRLEQRGLIERKANPRHQNIVEMWITGPGEELLAEADTAMIDLERRIAGFLGIKQTERLRSLLEALADGLERENKEFRGPSAEASKRD
jgi:DNA-binding MarR family transcriptional regulator